MATEGDEKPPPAEVLAEIKAVVARAKSGDAKAVPRLREFLARFPLLWQRYGDLAAQAEVAWVNLAAGTDLHLKESLLRFAAEQRALLTRPSASPIEKLLVDRAVACWLQLQYFSAIEAGAIAGKDAPKVLHFWAERQVVAQRLFESALASLVAAQKLLPVAAPTCAAPPPEHPPTPASGSETVIVYEDSPFDLHNRLGSYFNPSPESTPPSTGSRRVGLVDGGHTRRKGVRHVTPCPADRVGTDARPAVPRPAGA